MLSLFRHTNTNNNVQKVFTTVKRKVFMYKSLVQESGYLKTTSSATTSPVDCGLNS